MALYLFAVIISVCLQFAFMIPFINFLYRMKFQRVNQATRDAFNKPTPIFDKFHQHKSGTPVGGGIIIVLMTTVLFLLFLILFAAFNRSFHSNYPSVIAEIKIILFTFISFAFLGVYDDLNKIFFWKKRQFFGIRLRHKLILELILSFIIAFWLFSDLRISIINVPFFGVFNISYFYILFAAFVILSFANAINITDGLDGLAGGILMISLTGFWVVAHAILDVPTSIFIAVWLGGLISFLYFNIYPARIMMGDTGALSFGATFAVVGLILGKGFALPIFGGVFVLEIFSSFIQLLSKKYRHKKILPVAPLHLWLQLKGWPEPKIVMRFWIIGILFSLFGLMISFMK